MPAAFSRRSFLGASASLAAASVLPAAAVLAIPSGSLPSPSSAATPSWLSPFAHQYMQVMHAPGMIVTCDDGEKVESAAFGFSNLESRRPLSIDQPFCIGSITKSFVAIIALQLHDEGKLDLHKPVLEILPTLPIRNPVAPITAHHLLTHTSGLPNWLELISDCPTEIATQAYAPGQRFAYCNLGFDTLGLLIAHLDGRPWVDSLAARILKPLGMTTASGRIDAVTQTRLPTGYQYLYRDRPCVVSYPIVPGEPLTMDNAAGSISATAADMAKYIRMLAAGGIGPHGRLLSQESFRLLSTPYIKASVLSADAGYGYGIGVETIDGHKVLRHTGGMTAFASSIVIDLDSGVGAFASINAMQDYRPNPITLYAVQVLNSRKANKPTPPTPPLENPLEVENASDYQGVYRSMDGEQVTVTASGKQLTLTSTRGTSALYRISPDAFTAADGSIVDTALAPLPQAEKVPSQFGLVFGRTSSDPKSIVVELSIGSSWYTNEHYQGARSFPADPNIAKFVGKYTTDSPWEGMIRIVERNGKLWADGMDELHPNGENRFTMEGGEGPIYLEFFTFIGGRSHLLRASGAAFRRVEV